MSDPENIVPPEVGRQPRFCPTCGSEDPAMRLSSRGYGPKFYCTDPFHATTEGTSE